MGRLQPVLQFGDFQLDPEVPLLTRGSRVLELSPKALQVLALLVRNAHRVVSKDDLLSIVWPHSVVEEGNLAVHIHSLRRALGGGTGYIETIPKRGYRFAAPVVPVTEGGTDAPAYGERERFRIAAYYLQQQTAEGCRRAEAEYLAYLKTEPGNAEAKAGLANTLLFRLVLGDLGRNGALPRARALLEEAGRIDPACAGVHLSRSRLFCLGNWDWERAQEELQHALELARDIETESVVGAWQGCYLVEREEVEKGLRRLRWAGTVCPLSPFIARFSAEAHFLGRDFLGCLSVSRKALELHPHCWLLYRAAGKALTAIGEYGEARRCYRRAILLYNAPQSGLLAEVAYLEAAAGNEDKARDLLARVQSQPGRPLVAIAQIHAALGNKDRALDCLEEACVQRDWSLSGLRQDNRLDVLRATHRYRRVLAQVGI